MKITIIESADDVQVWASLEADVDPRRMSESFIIGGGPTRDAAIHAALAELDKARVWLEWARHHERPPFPANLVRREGQM